MAQSRPTLEYRQTDQRAKQDHDADTPAPAGLERYDNEGGEERRAGGDVRAAIDQQPDAIDCAHGGEGDGQRYKEPRPAIRNDAKRPLYWRHVANAVIISPNTSGITDKPSSWQSDSFEGLA